MRIFPHLFGGVADVVVIDGVVFFVADNDPT